MELRIIVKNPSPFLKKVLEFLCSYIPELHVELGGKPEEVQSLLLNEEKES